MRPGGAGAPSRPQLRHGCHGPAGTRSKLESGPARLRPPTCACLLLRLPCAGLRPRVRHAAAAGHDAEDGRALRSRRRQVHGRGRAGWAPAAPAQLPALPRRRCQGCAGAGACGARLPAPSRAAAAERAGCHTCRRAQLLLPQPAAPHLHAQGARQAPSCPNTHPVCSCTPLPPARLLPHAHRQRIALSSPPACLPPACAPQADPNNPKKPLEQQQLQYVPLQQALSTPLSKLTKRSHPLFPVLRGVQAVGSLPARRWPSA